MVSWTHRSTNGGRHDDQVRTLRLPADQAEALEAIAGVDEVSVNEEIQRAIAAHIELVGPTPTSDGA